MSAEEVNDLPHDNALKRQADDEVNPDAEDYFTCKPPKKSKPNLTNSEVDVLKAQIQTLQNEKDQIAEERDEAVRFAWNVVSKGTAAVSKFVFKACRLGGLWIACPIRKRGT